MPGNPTPDGFLSFGWLVLRPTLEWGWTGYLFFIFAVSGRLLARYPVSVQLLDKISASDWITDSANSNGGYLVSLDTFFTAMLQIRFKFDTDSDPRILFVEKLIRFLIRPKIEKIQKIFYSFFF